MGRLSQNWYPSRLPKRNKQAKAAKLQMQKRLNRKKQIEAYRCAVTHDHGFYEQSVSTDGKKLKTLYPVSRVNDQIKISVNKIKRHSNDEIHVEDYGHSTEKLEISVCKKDSRRNTLKLPKPDFLDSIRNEWNSETSSESTANESEIEMQDLDFKISNRNERLINSNASSALISFVAATSMEQEANLIDKNNEICEIINCTKNITPKCKNLSETVEGLKNSAKTSKLKPNFDEKILQQKELEVCILCAAKSNSDIANKSVSHFVKMIEGFSGINILKFNAPLNACNCCFKLLEQIDNFGKQIVYTSKLINTIGVLEKNQTDNELISKLQTNSLDCSNNTNKTNELVQEISKSEFEFTCKATQQNSAQDINSYKTDMQNLAREKHKTREKVECIECGILFQNVYLLQKHQYFHKNISTWKKLQAAKNAQSKTNLNLEKRDQLVVNIVNSGKSDSDVSEGDCLFQFSCTACGKPYTYKNVKYCNCKGVKNKEAKKEKFVCSMCGKQYPLSSSLLRHEIIHGEKKHLCSICGEAFHYLIYLKRHLKKHTGTKPFACPYCSKSFGTQWNLVQHKRLHTNSLPYKCRLCSAAYRHNVSLKKHIVMSHTASECAMINKKNKSIDNEQTGSKANDESNLNIEDRESLKSSPIIKTTNLEDEGKK